MRTARVFRLSRRNVSTIFRLLFVLLSSSILIFTLIGATCSEPLPAVKDPILPKTKAALGVGDVVEVRVFGEPDLSGLHQVSPEGSIRLPLIGRVSVVTLSADELAMMIESRYNEEYLQSAQVNIFVKEFNSRKIFVLGEVNRPGSIPFEENMTVIGAIAKAGGTTKIADSNRTILTREGSDGEKVRSAVPVSAIGRGQAPDVELAPGDIIFVPESPL